MLTSFQKLTSVTLAALVGLAALAPDSVTAQAAPRRSEQANPVAPAGTDAALTMRSGSVKNAPAGMTGNANTK